MASPSRAEIEGQISNIVRILDEFRLYCGMNAENYITHEDTFTQSLETEYADEAMSALFSFRSNLSAAREQAKAMLTPLIKEYGRFIEATETDPDSILTRMFPYFVANSLRVNSRGLTFGSPSFTGTGNGALTRLRKDRYGFDIEATTPDAKVATCTADQASGTNRHAERFQIVGAAAERDHLRITGSGKATELVALTALDSQAFVVNPSFSQYAGTLAVPTAITGWTTQSGNFTNYQIDTTNYYRAYPGDTTPAALQIGTSGDIIRQPFTTRPARFAPGVPMYVQLAWNRQIGSATTGTLILRFGNVQTLVSIGALTGWQVLRLGPSSLNWYDNFRADAADIEIEWQGAGSGTLLVDDLIVAPYTIFDGTYYAIVGGSTPFLRGDEFTFTDSVAAEGLIQLWLWLAFGRYLPHDGAGSAVTWTDPT